MDDKRQLVRKSTAWPAEICSRSGVIPATILDLSAEGARVELAFEAVLTGRCFLKASLFPEDIRCKVVWQTRAEIGLAFMKKTARTTARADLD